MKDKKGLRLKAFLSIVFLLFLKVSNAAGVIFSTTYGCLISSAAEILADRDRKLGIATIFSTTFLSI